MTVADVVAAAPGGARGLLVTEYEALAATGLLDDEPVELIEGVLVRMMIQRPPHAEATRRTMVALVAQRPEGWQVSCQAPLVMGVASEPEPDLAVVPDEDYSDHHPSSAALVVEVARSSLAFDLGVKARMYAAGGVTEYWVLDVAGRCLHVHRDAGPEGYGSVTVVSRGEVTTAAGPSITLDVDAVLPSR